MAQQGQEAVIGIRFIQHSPHLAGHKIHAVFLELNRSVDGHLPNLGRDFIQHPQQMPLIQNDDRRGRKPIEPARKLCLPLRLHIPRSADAERIGGRGAGIQLQPQLLGRKTPFLPCGAIAQYDKVAFGRNLHGRLQFFGRLRLGQPAHIHPRHRHPRKDEVLVFSLVSGGRRARGQQEQNQPRNWP